MLNEIDWRAILKEHRIFSRMRCLLTVYFMTPPDTRIRKCLPYEMEVASKDIAEMMEISRPSVHVLLDALQKEGLVYKEHYGRVVLTSPGQIKAAYLRKHLSLMTEMIGNQLGTTLLESAVLACQCVDMMDAERLDEIENMTTAEEKGVISC